jgi:predicted dehydrogenase
VAKTSPAPKKSAPKATSKKASKPKKAPGKVAATARVTAPAKMPDVIGIGMVGAGGIAQAVHIPGYQALANARVLAVSDPSDAARASACEKFGIESSYADFGEMLKRNDIHAISVTTPNFLHAEATIAALEAGKHVLCEKPLAMNAQEGEAMVAASKRTGMKLMCGYNQRFSPQIQTLKKFADAGTFGGIYHARAQALRRRGIPGWGLFISKEKNGGGPLIDIGVHILDATMHIMGFPKPIAVSGQTYQKFGKRDDVMGLMGQWDYKNFTVEDFATALIRFENGSTLTLESAFVANQPEAEKFSAQLYGDKGGAISHPLQMFTEEHGTLLDITPAFLPTNVNSHAAEIASFVDSIVNDKPVFTPGEQALEITRIIDAIYQSSEEGREIRFD